MFEFLLIATMITGPEAGESQIAMFYTTRERCEEAKPEVERLMGRLTQYDFTLECWDALPPEKRAEREYEIAVREYIDRCATWEMLVRVARDGATIRDLELNPPRDRAGRVKKPTLTECQDTKREMSELYPNFKPPPVPRPPSASYRPSGSGDEVGRDFKDAERRELDELIEKAQ